MLNMENPAEMFKKICIVCAYDMNFRSKFMQNPRETLESLGINLPSNYKITVTEGEADETKIIDEATIQISIPPFVEQLQY